MAWVLALTEVTTRVLAHPQRPILVALAAGQWRFLCRGFGRLRLLHHMGLLLTVRRTVLGRFSAEPSWDWFFYPSAT